MVSVTLDTNLYNHRSLVERAVARSLSVAFTSVSDRELANAYQPVPAPRDVLETGVFGESEWGRAVWASDSDGEVLEQVLRVVSSGSVPRNCEPGELPAGLRNHLRDAIALCAHFRERRDIFVSDDTKAFVSHGRREILEALLGTRIMSTAEFSEWLENQPS
ncbi:MAG TPA: hypothetical protein VMW35_02705 [Myxococcota bacterium]|nr:hypothetical protein [Myxococcota bacterium]